MHSAWIAWANWIWYGTLVLSAGMLVYLMMYRRKRHKNK